MRRTLTIFVGLLMILPLLGSTPSEESCPPPLPTPAAGEPRVWFLNERDYVTRIPFSYGDELPVRTIATGDIAVWHPEGVAPGGFNFTIDFHQARQDIREWMTQHIWPGRLLPGRRMIIGVWQQRTFPGVNVIDIHTNIVDVGSGREDADYRICWIGR